MADTTDWRRFALLLIDVQRDFWPAATAKAFPEFPTNVERLLEYSRSSGLEIVHVRAEFDPDGTDWMSPYRIKGETPCVRGTSGAGVLPCAAERTGETVLRKRTFDAFLQPDLLTHLHRARKSFILVAGLETSVCVLLTAASAVQRGFLAAVVEDCCADDPFKHAAAITGYPFVFERTTLATLETDHGRWTAMLNDLKSFGG
ncbi:MAG: cysteine hydrolase [Gemmatimonadetes bacterium]|nr:cysteine hydrolase [Gemmatimonadota bacterium]